VERVCPFQARPRYDKHIFLLFSVRKLQLVTGSVRKLSAAASLAPETWAISDGRAGLETQVLGLAEAVGLPHKVKTVHPIWPWTMLPVRHWPMPLAALGRGSSEFKPPWPALAIGCGWRSIPFVLAIKRLSGGRTLTVQTQNPRIDPRNFDIVIAPEHDRLRGPNVLSILGSPNRITPERLAEAAEEWRSQLAYVAQPRVAVLIGGSSKAYRLTPQRMSEIAGELKALAATGAGLMVTTSRRTGADVTNVLVQELEGTGAFIWSGEGANPYFGLLGLADAILVTADSTNMITESAATGKPLHILPLLRGSTKFGRFHEALVERGLARPFIGKLERWSYPALNETRRAANFIREKLGPESGKFATPDL
jgi:mitochondrial fission protein ELM1